jgi:hypothetical protein
LESKQQPDLEPEEIERVLGIADTADLTETNQTNLTEDEILKAVEFEIEPIDFVQPEEIEKLKIIKHKKSKKKKRKSTKEEKKNKKKQTDEKNDKITSNDSNKAQETVSNEKKVPSKKSRSTQIKGEIDEKPENTNIQKIATKINKRQTDANLPISSDNVQLSFESLELNIKDDTAEGPSEKIKREIVVSGEFDDLEKLPSKRAILTSGNSAKENFNKNVQQHNQLPSNKNKKDTTEEQRAERVNQVRFILLRNIKGERFLDNVCLLSGYAKSIDPSQCFSSSR